MMLMKHVRTIPSMNSLIMRFCPGKRSICFTSEQTPTLPDIYVTVGAWQAPVAPHPRNSYARPPFPHQSCEE